MSGRSSLFKRMLYKIPYLYKKCPSGNYHLFSDRVCVCGEFDCALYDFKTKKKYILFETPYTKSYDIIFDINSDIVQRILIDDTCKQCEHFRSVKLMDGELNCCNKFWEKRLEFVGSEWKHKQYTVDIECPYKMERLVLNQTDIGNNNE